MDSFGKQGTATNITDAVAALALVRGLIRKLKNKDIIDQDDINSIVDDALIQTKTLGTAGANEARQLIRSLLNRSFFRPLLRGPMTVRKLSPSKTHCW
jgi:hypothetical protein